MANQHVTVEQVHRQPLERQRIELVERKGQGHPDSICDAVAEEISHALCREYLAAFGRILHYNADKALLVAGRTEPRPGGGTVLEPMRFVLGDRASRRCGDREIDVVGIAEAAARSRLRQNLRYVDAGQHVTFQNELKAGSPELTDIFARQVIGANDTSAAVGYAPLTETERLVLEAERWLNSPACHQVFPEAGEDVKVMGVRRDRRLDLTVAVAFVDRYVPDCKHYFDRKEALRRALLEHLHGCLRDLQEVTVQLNTLDDPERGTDGVYLTVLGTSAEGGDCGQVGRGNRVNGVIPLNRPISNEAAAGKNPVSHVGKIYSLLTHEMARAVIARVPGVAEAYVWLCSQIGRPIDEPVIAAAQVILRPGVGLPEVEPAVEELLQQELSRIQGFSERIIRGEFTVW